MVASLPVGPNLREITPMSVYAHPGSEKLSSVRSGINNCSRLLAICYTWATTFHLVNESTARGWRCSIIVLMTSYRSTKTTDIDVRLKVRDEEGRAFNDRRWHHPRERQLDSPLDMGRWKIAARRCDNSEERSRSFVED